MKRAKITAEIRAVFLPPPMCRVQKRQRVPPHTAQGGSERSFEWKIFQTWLTRRWKSWSNRTCENVGWVSPRPLPSVPVRYNLCASDTPSKHNVFHVLSSACKSAHSELFLARACLDFRVKRFHIFLAYSRWNNAAWWRLVDEKKKLRTKVDFLLHCSRSELVFRVSSFQKWAVNCED